MRKQRHPGEVIEELCRIAGISVTELARRSGVPQSTLSRIVRKAIADPTNGVLTAIARYFKVSVAELRDEPGAAILSRDVKSNISTGPELKAVPLLPWASAGRVMTYRARIEQQEMVYTSRVAGPRTYALRIEGDSMEPRFAAGAVIIVDPDAQASNGRFVIARIEPDSEVIFRRYMREGSRVYLAPLNPRYPIVELGTGGSVAGVVVQAILDCD